MFAGVIVAMAALMACGDSGGKTSASDSNSASASDGTGSSSGTDSDGSQSASMSEAEPTEGGMSATGTGTTDISGSMSDSETMGGGSGNETEGMSGGTGQESQGGSGGTTAEMTTEPAETSDEPIDCTTALTKADCIALGCMPVDGRAFEFDGAEWCLNDLPSFLGCLPQMICDDAITTVCKGQNTYQLPNGCFPNGFQICEPPPDPGMNGYKSC